MLTGVTPDLPDPSKRPILILLTSHWVSMAGVALVTLAGVSWIFLLPLNLRGQVSNPYIGLLVFGAVPAVFFTGLALIPIGLALSRRHVASDFSVLPNRRAAWRRAGIFLAVMTLANLVIGSQLSYRAVEHMETVQFCGQSCHVMQPEFTAHMLPPHTQVSCASCHIGPGAAGWFRAKIGGMRQLKNVVFDSFPRPIESGLESGRLASSVDTCEQCHARERVIGSRLKVVQKYKDDQANSPIESVLMMKIGGGATGGIHGAHMGPGVRIRYAAPDKRRQTIPWVEIENTATSQKQTFLAGDAKPESIAALPVFEMQCVDCHNRAAHSFQSPDAAIDQAIAAGQIAPTLPFAKKTGLALLKARYANQEDAAQKIQAGLNDFYQSNYGDVWAKQSNDVQRAGQALTAAYAHNVFPDLRVTWATYPNNLGHVDDPGCFRCHDGSHSTSDQKSTINQDCSACHDLFATDESSPAILKTLGLENPVQKGNP
jgi:nitrate/TMAO reductase-like tetraheme cytochrome c subunit